MDDFEDVDLGLDDPELGLDDPHLLADVDVPAGTDVLADPAALDALADPALFEAAAAGDAVADVPLEPGGTVGEVVEIEYIEWEEITWMPGPLEEPEAAGVVGVGSVVAGARLVGAVRSARDVMKATRSLGKKVGKRLPSRRRRADEGNDEKPPADEPAE
jgi:hypothetical protein